MTDTARTKKKKHKTTKQGTGDAQREVVKPDVPTDDPAKPSGIEYKTLDKDPTYGAEFDYDWTAGGCFNTACTQKHITITTAKWEATYIKALAVEGIPNLTSVKLHKRVVPQFKAFFKAIVKKGLTGNVTSYAGAFTKRTITNKDTVRSNHALGTAIDINAPENAYGTKGADRGAKGSVRELADFCADFGLYWGGWYSKSKDLMHFEAVKILEGAALRAACEKHGVVYEDVVEVIGDFPTPSGTTMMA
ncbi:MAG: M15 family metallopeptidase [Myxococcales bacterium]|nr:M15 family metallopeptidase [Myxococcales bacterium]